MGSSGCLDERTVVEFLSGLMEPPRRTSVEAHLDACTSCMELTAWAAADHAERSRAPGDEGRPFIGALSPGSRIDRYQILGAIGRGGMGEVYAAYHPDLDRRIALKVVGDAGADSTQRARLLREARAIARLSHPNVVSVYDAGTVDERVYIAMEFVEGQTVDAWLRAERRPWRQVLDVFSAAGRGLAAAHAAGIIHRDFKPQNVMVGRGGSVRVMDFGLARLADEPADAQPLAGAAPERRTPANVMVTKAGTLIGTIAYMAPEQYRGEAIDARADQFSFCVAVHEAIYGRRPTLRHLGRPVGGQTGGKDVKATTTTRHASSPAWLRAVVARGLSENREQRFASMDALLAAIGRGQARIRRRTVALVCGVVIAASGLGTWRLAAARHASCAVPADRLAAVWAARDEASPRRRAVHRAFGATGVPTAESAWRRVAAALDEYTTQWSAMYVSACEATHVRHEQSTDALDLRMDCLNETLDGVRALTEVLSRADGTIVSQAVTAAQSLPPVSRCADVAGLRAAVPAPRDATTASAVADVRRAVRDAFALQDVGDERQALAKARALLPRAEATGYKPVIAEVLYAIAHFLSDGYPRDAEPMMERALDTAEMARDDVTAAKAAIGLVYLTGFSPEQRHECDRWESLAMAMLERLPPPQRLLHAWLLNNEGTVRINRRELEAARPLLEQSIVLKEEELGKSSPDVARGTSTLASILTDLGRPEEALQMADRAIQIMRTADPEGVVLAFALNNRGDTWRELKRYGEAEADYRASLRIMRLQFGARSYKDAYPTFGLGSLEIRQGDAAAAIPYFEEALQLQDGHDPDLVAVADTRFALARALVASGRDRARARALVAAARDIYADRGQPDKRREAEEWLAAHAGSAKQ